MTLLKRIVCFRAGHGRKESEGANLFLFIVLNIGLLCSPYHSSERRRSILLWLRPSYVR